MIWWGIAGLLLAWLAGLVLVQAPFVNLLLIAAAGLLVAQVINERESGA